MSAELKELIFETQAKFKADPDEAKAVFRSESALQQGMQSRVTLGDHEIVVDEPESLGGANTGPNPVELILAALGSCQEITYRAYATALDIPLESVSVTLEGNIDLRGFFGVDDSVRPGYQGIKGTVRINSSADEATLQMLRTAVNAHCPVLDILAKPVPVELDLSIEQTAAAAAE